MSTRCNILVHAKDGSKHQYYHHYDGYPSGVGAELCDWFDKYFDGDTEKESMNAVTIMADLASNNKGYEYEGEEINIHGDIEYLYEINDTEDEIKIICFQYACIEDWDNDTYITQKREECSWTFHRQQWSDWYKEGKEKLKKDKPIQTGDILFPILGRK